MGDCEETDFFWESWTSPVKRKRKKNLKKAKKCNNNNIAMTTAESTQKKKKKKDKFKEAMGERKEKKKEKKKRKTRLALEADGSSVFTQGGDARAKPAVKPEVSNPRGPDKLNPDQLTQDSKKKSKRKKKVAFDLSPGYIRVKRPKFAPSSSQRPEEGAFSENGAGRDGDSCLRADRGPACDDDDSQCNSEDINSQDLFITQKTFRASPSEPSSGEASEKAVTSTPEMMMFTQRLEGSHRCPQDSHVRQCHRRTKEQEEKTETVQVEEEEEEDVLNKAHRNPNKGKLCFQTQAELNAAEKRAHVKPSVVNSEPIVVDASPDVVKSKKRSRTSLDQSTTSASTQTENLFTTELSFYLNFCRRRTVTTHSENLKPLDLSLPERARKDLQACLSANASSSPGRTKGDDRKEPNPRPSCVEASGQHPCSVSKGGKGEASLSPQSESEPKSADTTTSSEDNEAPCRTGRLDLTQVRAVQMRLNESFFFKTKGEGQSPRPESPLMKLAQGRDVKSRKGH